MDMGTLYLLLVSAVLVTGEHLSRKEHRGPTIRTEPPFRVEFSNSSGAELRCGADGAPPPRVAWHGRDGTPLADVPGLRHALPDGTLAFQPFSRAEYREAVHSALYRCVASNAVGAVMTRDVHVRGVIRQRFTPQVKVDDYAYLDNMAVLKCEVPVFVREFVTLDSWLRSDNKMIKFESDEKWKSEKTVSVRGYTVLNTGELLIHQAKEKESEYSFTCLVRHRLTGEMVNSLPRKITVREIYTSTLPEISFYHSEVRAEEGQFVQLPCVARGNPTPTYKWMKDENGVQRQVHNSRNVWVVDKLGTLTIQSVRLSDAAKYQCVARNSIGERRFETNLIVTAPLHVTVLPSRQELNAGQEATFTCNVSGGPVRSVSWRKDLQPLVGGGRVHLLSRDVLHISALRREDRGMYQCFVYNEHDGAQASAELVISDVPPSLLFVFPESHSLPGSPVSLKCVATGNPPPRVTWFLDGIPLKPTGRVSFGDYLTEHSQVVSHLNISAADVRDGGEYTCHVANDVGSVWHAARLNVNGHVFLRPMPNVTAFSGEDLTMRCPYGGHPIKWVRWFKGGLQLPLSIRHKVSHGGHLTIHGVQRAPDEGEYSCSVRGDDGAVVQGATFVQVVVSPAIDPHFFRESNTVDEGGRTKLVCIVTRGDPPLHFTWLKNGQPFFASGGATVQTTEDSSIVTFKKVSSGDRGLYTCVVKNMASSANMTMQIIVNVPPQWSAEPKNSTVVLGNTVSMNCSAVGFPAPSVLWKKLVYTENVAGDFTYVHSSPRSSRFNNGTLVISEAQESDSGAYLCQASNGIGAGLTKIVHLQVLVPPQFKEHTLSQTCRENENATLKCDAVGHAPITITWFKNKVPLDAKSNKRYFIRNFSRKHQTTSDLTILKAERGDSTNFSCQAVSEYGKDETHIQFLVQGLPDSPTNISVLNVTSRAVSLFWEVTHNGNSHITGSIVQYQSVSDSHWNGQTSQLIVSGVENSATLRALTPVTLYYVRILSENALGQSKPSQVINITTEEESPSGTPREVQVHSTGAQSIKVTWKPPPEESQHGHIKGYYIGYRTSSTPESYTFKQVDANPTKEQQSTYITGLLPFTKYDIVVKAYNSAGAGPKSPKITGKTLETAPPTSPVVQIEGSTSSTIDISWKKDVKDKAAIPEYTVHYKSEDGEWRSEHVGSGVDRYTLRGLKCGTRYQMYMTASNSLGTGEPSTPVFTRTKGAAPMSPQESVFVRPNPTSLTLHLSAWRDGGCPILRFSVRHRPKHHPQAQWIEASPLEAPLDAYAVRHLVPDREYVVMVTAHSEAGLTQAEYEARTLPAVAISPPAFGKRETGLPFYKNVALVVPVVVSSLVILVLVFAIVVCFRKHSHDRRGRNDYDNRKPVGDNLMMSDMTKQIMNKSTKISHYTCPNTGKTEYAEPYTCNDTNTSRQQGSDGLFATIKRCPTRPIYMSASYKQGSESFCSQHSTPHETRPEPTSEKWSNPRNNSKPMR